MYEITDHDREVMDRWGITSTDLLTDPDDDIYFPSYEDDDYEEDYEEDDDYDPNVEEEENVDELALARSILHQIRVGSKRDAALEETINIAIRRIEGRSRARCLTAAQIFKTLDLVEAHLGIRKKFLNGISIVADPNARSFKGWPEVPHLSTSFMATYRSGAWRITDITRTDCRDPRYAIEIHLTPAAEEAILDRARVIMKK